MTDAELDMRLGALLREPEPEADQAFIDRTMLAARIDRDIRHARQRAFRRALIDGAGAVAVAATFFLLSQAQVPSPDGIIPFQGPAMAGLVMLGLWSLVSFPRATGRMRTA
jgi:hypothetical protein